MFTKDREYKEPISEQQAAGISTKTEYEQVIELIPENYQKRYKSLPGLLQKHLKSKELAYVKANVIYSVANSDGKLMGYLKRSLDHNFAEFGKTVTTADEIAGKAMLKKCASAKNGGACGATWQTCKHDKASACYWCDKMKKNRLAQEKLETQPVEVDAQSEPLSEVEILKRQMQQMQQAQIEREQALKQEIEKIKAEKKTPNLNKNPSLFNLQRHKKTIKSVNTVKNGIDSHQAPPKNPTENRIVGKWWLVRDKVKNQMDESVYKYVELLTVDFSRSNIDELMLIFMNSYAKDTLSKKGATTLIGTTAENMG
ncbi:MAG: hypothetical protein GY718_03785, partial [Lentisphaerae bacterium]|nr:hypothetical protein [Lentisphaerota bacterium]